MEGASLGINDLLMEGNSVIVVSWVSQGKRGSWKLGRWTHKIIDLLCGLCCFFTWILGEASQVPDDMANHGALMLEIFLRTLYHISWFCICFLDFLVGVLWVLHL